VGGANAARTAREGPTGIFQAASEQASSRKEIIMTVSSLDSCRSAEAAFWNSFGASPTERFLDLGPSLRVRVQESGQGPPALFIHGTMTAGGAFAPLIARMRGFRCIALDRPGCGLSDAWQLHPEFRDQAVETILGVLDALRIDSVVLAGHSLGALWCTWFALAHPRRVRKLALIGPSIGFPGVHPPGFMRVLSIPGFGALLRRAMRPSRKSLERSFVSMGHGKSLRAGRFPTAMFDWGERLMIDTRTMQNELEAVTRAVGFAGARRWTVLGDTLRTLSVPTLLVSGTDDSHGGPSLAANAARLIPVSKVHIVEHAGHVPWLDNPAAVADAVSSFANPVSNEVTRDRVVAEGI
jgi:2-hydroxy-6-oxonona-2,4-dienedioate hydrolase